MSEEQWTVTQLRTEIERVEKILDEARQIADTLGEGHVYNELMDAYFCTERALERLNWGVETNGGDA